MRLGLGRGWVGVRPDEIESPHEALNVGAVEIREEKENAKMQRKKEEKREREKWGRTSDE